MFADPLQCCQPSEKLQIPPSFSSRNCHAPQTFLVVAKINTLHHTSYKYAYYLPHNNEILHRYSDFQFRPQFIFYVKNREAVCEFLKLHFRDCIKQKLGLK